MLVTAVALNLKATSTALTDKMAASNPLVESVLLGKDRKIIGTKK